ncbi:unnamed protein product [Rhizoctonia solani]|uniref:Transmembrane protein n=1 Tax=Rhizoctonia solani TaxID=456999 RepID=A0A8H3DP40_9AGAM|nr:unnamed protein product [Rhizoctonia solani]
MVYHNHFYTHTSRRTRWLIRVFGPWTLALLLSLGNHFLYAALNGRNVFLYNQFWINVLKNAWAMVVHACLIWSAGTIFSTMVWSSLVGRSLPIKAVDSALQLPSLAPVLQIIFSPSIKSLHRPVFWSTCLIAYVLVTLTPPAALNIRAMIPIQSQLRIPSIDFSVDPRLYAVMRENWDYIRPSNRLRRFMRNRVTSNTVMGWNAPPQCSHGCSYNATYFAPGMRCVDYTPDPTNPGLNQNETYHAGFNISDSYLSFNMTLWPISNGVRQIGAYNTTPIATRCTFHNASYTAFTTFGNNLQYSKVLSRTIISDQPMAGLSRGFVNSYSCPRSPTWNISRPQSAPSCAKVQVNTWAFIDAFANALSGSIVIYPFAIGPGSQYPNNALLPNLDYLFSVDEDSRAFNLSPWAKNLGLGNALEYLFTNATLSLTQDALVQGWTSVTDQALVRPFVNQYVYQPSQLWLAYGSALAITWAAGLFAYMSCDDASVPGDETSLSKILTTTRDRSFNRINGLSEREVDEIVVKYGGGKSGALFTVVSERRVHGSESTIAVEEAGLLRKWSLRSV